MRDCHSSHKAASTVPACMCMCTPVLAVPADPGSVGKVVLRRNALVGNAGSQRADPLPQRPESGAPDQRASPGDETEEIQEAALVVMSLGFDVRLAATLKKVSRADSLAVASEQAHNSEEELGQMLSAAGRLKHCDGRVLGPRSLKGGQSAVSREDTSYAVLGGVYVSGWCKHGPKGTIADALFDAQETASQIVKDIAALPRPSLSLSRISDQTPSPETIQAPHAKNLQNDACRRLDALLKIRKVRFVTFEQWQQVQELERQAGEREGRSARKFASVAEILHAAGD